MKLIKKEYITKPSIVYDLTVEDNHNYFVNGVCVSNCHTARGNVIQQLLVKYGTHLIFRYGVTGTLPPNKADEMAVKSALGQVVMTISAKYLQDRGFISTLNINMYEMKENIDTKAFPDYESETTNLS